MAAEDTRYVMADQYANPANPRAHYETTGPEIVADCPEIDVFVAGLGTGGTLMGVGRRLREHNPAVKVYAAEPMPGEMVQGLRSLDDGFVPEIFDAAAIDGRFLVTTAESIEALRRLTATEGIFAGVSSGGVLAVASRIARTDGKRHDRCAAGRRRLEVSVRGRLVARPRGRIGGVTQPMVKEPW